MLARGVFQQPVNAIHALLLVFLPARTKFYFDKVIFE